MKKNSEIKIVAENRRAQHDYEILEKYEAGLVLIGSEIKSIRAGEVSINEAFGKASGEELFLVNAYIAPYKQARVESYDPRRSRKLLLHKDEIKRLIGKLQQKGLVLVPLKLYLKNGWAKLELGLGKGKKLFDKREEIKKKEIKKKLKRF